MQREMQVAILKELMDRMDRNITCDAGRVLVNPATAYTDQALANREWDTFFANHPQVIGLSGELPKPGSYLTTSDFGIPLLATRDADGKFRAFVNACRHRGAHVAAEPRGEASRFVCPFHGWTYRNDGRLMGVRSPEQFGAIDKSCHNLIELPSMERHGFLIVHPKVDGVLDADVLFDRLAPEIAAWDLGRAEYRGETVLDMPVNWKIANDTFGENYHFASLHKNTLGNLLHSDVATYDEYGRNHRIVVASRYLDAMREQPESSWRITDGAVIAYYLFPNTQLVVLNGMLALARIFPHRKDVGKSITRVSHFALAQPAAQAEDTSGAQVLNAQNLYQADVSQRMEFTLEATAELFVSTVEHEDYYMGTKSQEAANSGLVEYFLFGRNEPALHHFHNNYRSALGQPPLAEYTP